jgi:hypothetical protein
MYVLRFRSLEHRLNKYVLRMKNYSHGIWCRNNIQPFIIEYQSRFDILQRRKVQVFPIMYLLKCPGILIFDPFLVFIIEI